MGAGGGWAGASEGSIINEILEYGGRVKVFRSLKVRGGSSF